MESNRIGGTKNLLRKLKQDANRLLKDVPNEVRRAIHNCPALSLSMKMINPSDGMESTKRAATEIFLKNDFPLNSLVSLDWPYWFA